MSDGLLLSATAWFTLLPWFGLGLALPLSFDFFLGFLLSIFVFLQLSLLFLGFLCAAVLCVVAVRLVV